MVGSEPVELWRKDPIAFFVEHFPNEVTALSEALNDVLAAANAGAHDQTKPASLNKIQPLIDTIELGLDERNLVPIVNIVEATRALYFALASQAEEILIEQGVENKIVSASGITRDGEVVPLGDEKGPTRH